MHKLLFLTLLLFTVISHAQNHYKEGYYVDLDGNKNSCYFKPFKTSTNPSVLTYRHELEQQDATLFVQDLSEIGIGDEVYIISNVEIDNRSNDLQKLMGTERSHQFVFEEQRLFLKVLINGDATLYETNWNNIQKFFFKEHPDAQITQLLYRRYFAYRGNDPFYVGPDRIVENNGYKRQLASQLTCKRKNGSYVLPSKFSKSTLIPYFKKYNRGKCK